jgi:hypothetical protein
MTCDALANLRNSTDILNPHFLACQGAAPAARRRLRPAFPTRPGSAAENLFLATAFGKLLVTVLRYARRIGLV